MDYFRVFASSYVRLLALAGLFLALLCAPALAAQTHFLPAPVATHNGIASLPQWTKILQSYENNLGTYALCAKSPTQCPSQRIAVWQQFIGAAKGQPDFRQIAYVNHWVNRLPYRLDDSIYGDNDHWASVEEFLDYSGDCEDFAIMKYLTLRQMGFSANSMHIAMVYDIFSGTDHAFLVVESDGIEYVLDNRETGTEPSLFTARYKPHFTFNEKSLSTYDSPLMARTIRKDEEILTGNR
jgi:predicted transglutaminase-like cysteine proteinase